MCMQTNHMKMLSASISEMMGTFLVTIVTAMAFQSQENAALAALIIGLAYFVAQFNGLGVCGGHFNPIVTLGLALNCPDFGWDRLCYYVVFQFLGAIFGGLLALNSFTGTTYAGPVASDDGQAVLAEIVFSFFLVYTAIRTDQKGDVFGAAQGLAYFVGIALSAAYSGGSLNPAVSSGIFTGASVADDAFEGDHAWIYFVGPLVGMVAAVIYHTLVEFLNSCQGKQVAYTASPQLTGQGGQNRGVQMPPMNQYGGQL